MYGCTHTSIHTHVNTYNTATHMTERGEGGERKKKREGENPEGRRNEERKGEREERRKGER